MAEQQFGINPKSLLVQCWINWQFGVMPSRTRTLSATLLCVFHPGSEVWTEAIFTLGQQKWKIDQSLLCQIIKSNSRDPRLLSELFTNPIMARTSDSEVFIIAFIKAYNYSYRQIARMHKLGITLRGFVNHKKTLDPRLQLIAKGFMRHNHPEVSMHGIALLPYITVITKSELLTLMRATRSRRPQTRMCAFNTINTILRNRLSDRDVIRVLANHNTVVRAKRYLSRNRDPLMKLVYRSYITLVTQLERKDPKK